MNVLKDKSSKTYYYTSRYATLPYYYNTLDKKYVYGISKNLNTNTDYVLHNLVDSDSLDSLALKYYGRPDLFWVIADFNNLNDPYIKLVDKMSSIKIPSLSGITWR